MSTPTLGVRTRCFQVDQHIPSDSITRIMRVLLSLELLESFLLRIIMDNKCWRLLILHSNIQQCFRSIQFKWALSYSGIAGLASVKNRNHKLEDALMIYWLSTDSYWPSTDSQFTSTDFYWLLTDIYLLSSYSYWLLLIYSLLTFTDTLLTSNNFYWLSTVTTDQLKLWATL